MDDFKSLAKELRAFKAETEDRLNRLERGQRVAAHKAAEPKKADAKADKADAAKKD